MGRPGPVAGADGLSAAPLGAWVVPRRGFGAALWLVLLLGLLACPGRDAASTGERRPSSVTLIGIDGASWVAMQPMLERGELPAFASLQRDGAWNPRFGTLTPTRSPALWTTVSTGRRPEDHGVTDFVERLADGTVLPVTSASRRQKAIWELLSEEGRAVGVVSWWASFPPDPVRGFLVSDRANPAMSDFWVDDRRFWTAARDHADAVSPTFPPSLADSLASIWPTRVSLPIDALAREARLAPATVERIVAAPWSERSLYSQIKTYLAVDAPLVEVATRLWSRQDLALRLLYLRGPDPAQHYGWDAIRPEEFAHRRDDEATARDAVEGVYRLMDSFVGRIAAQTSPDDWLIVLSDHGFQANELERPAEGREWRPGLHDQAPPGVFFLRGPQVRRGVRLDVGSLLDVFPTMAWLLDLPVSSELDGAILRDAFEPPLRDRPARRVDSYGPRQPRARSPLDDDAEQLRALEALGYLEREEARAAEPHPPE